MPRHRLVLQLRDTGDDEDGTDRQSDSDILPYSTIRMIIVDAWQQKLYKTLWQSPARLRQALRWDAASKVLHMFWMRACSTAHSEWIFINAKMFHMILLIIWNNLGFFASHFSTGNGVAFCYAFSLVDGSFAFCFQLNFFSGPAVTVEYLMGFDSPASR